MKNSVVITAIIFVFAKWAVGQSMLFPQEYLFEQSKRNLYYQSFDTLRNFHSAIFPLQDSTADYFDKINFQKPERKWLARKLFQDHLINIQKKDTVAGEVNDIKIIINPVFNFEYGQYRINKPLPASDNAYVNTRGVIARIEINKKFRIESAFIENQAVFIPYLKSNITASKDVLGQGRWKSFKTNGFDYAMASGVLWWKPSKNFEIFAGHGKQKIGNGYHSLLLSDQAFNYPYFRFDFNFAKGHFKYITEYALLTNLTPTFNSNPALHTPFGTEVLFQKKPFSMQYLSWIPHKRVNIGVFQGMVWKPSDERNNLNLSANFFNPVVFVNPALYGFDSVPKILFGMDVSVKITEGLHLYAQGASDGKKTVYNNQIGAGLIAGFKFYNVFGLKNLFLQGEGLIYRNGLYFSNSAASSSSYTHYNRFLTLPSYSTDGNELTGIAGYRLKRFFINSKVSLLMHYNDIKKSNYIFNADNRLGFIINSRTNMNISAGLMAHNNNTTKHKNPFATGTFEQLIYFSFRTSLYNIYTDI